MAFRYRRSISLGGGFRINLTSSGIGYSWGTKGFRISRTARGTTRKTYYIPGTGISYSSESGGERRNRRERGNSTSSQPLDFSKEREIVKDKIKELKQSDEGTIADALERTMNLDFIGTLLLFTVILAVIHPVFLLIPLVGAILKIAAHTLGRVNLEYSFDAEKQDEHTRRIDAWELLVEGDREWQILPGNNSGRKPNAEAEIKRVECKVEKGHPYYINTNVDTIQISLANKEKLIILPDKVFFERKRKIDAIDYSDFRISVSSVQFVEREKVPGDATIVGETWQYVNRNGTPDRVKRNNKRIPICDYGRIFLRSKSGVNIELQISNLQNTRDFAELIN